MYLATPSHGVDFLGYMLEVLDQLLRPGWVDAHAVVRVVGISCGGGGFLRHGTHVVVRSVA